LAAQERTGESSLARPGTRDAIRPRERLLATAYDLFAANGVSQVGIDTILATSRCAKASLYSHFRSTDRQNMKNTKSNLAAAIPALRDTGLGFIGDVPWGTHLCLFYETKEDLLETAVAYFKAGLESKEFCIWAISEPLTEGEARTALRRAVPDFDRHWAAGSIEFMPAREWYLKRGRVDLQRIIGAWNEKLRGALAKGYEGMRASGIAAWLGPHHWKDFSDYEHELDRSLAGKTMTVLCTYPLAGSKPSDILDVVRAHQVTAARRKGDWACIADLQVRRTRRGRGLELVQNSPGSHAPREGTAAGAAGLTSRERHVLNLVVKGHSNKEIARILRIGQRTVESHRASLMKKIGARSIAELVRFAIVGTPDEKA
jgi:DNA-binding CsgD family transcriptional regulator/AcrR family transcriptional regulator